VGFAIQISNSDSTNAVQRQLTCTDQNQDVKLTLRAGEFYDVE